MTVKDTGTGFGIGFIVGATIGLLIGFLYAPQPGVETRKLVKEKAEKMMTKVTGAVDKLQESSAKARYKKRLAEQHGKG